MGREAAFLLRTHESAVRRGQQRRAGDGPDPMQGVQRPVREAIRSAMAFSSSPADGWIAERMRHIESSGIRKVFELARSLKDPVNLSIGQPDFDVPEPAKRAAHAAIDAGRNAYTVTQGIPELRAKILADVRARYPRAERELFITSGTSGGLVLALLCTVNPGDE